VPPNVLVKYNVSCCRSIQEQGQFIVVFPRAYSSNICTGYSVSESVYFASRFESNFDFNLITLLSGRMFETDAVLAVKKESTVSGFFAFLGLVVRAEDS
jgi:hypothetical protein